MDFILNNWLLFLALLIVLGLLAMNMARDKLLGFRELKPNEMVQLMNRDEPALLDTRSEEEYGKGHILGARNIPHDQLPDRLGELEEWRGRKVVVYCRTGQRAAVAAGQLKKAGFEAVYKLNGGVLAWQGAGLPLVTGGAEESSATQDTHDDDAPALPEPDRESTTASAEKRTTGA